MAGYAQAHSAGGAASAEAAGRKRKEHPEPTEVASVAGANSSEPGLMVPSGVETVALDESGQPLDLSGGAFGSADACFSEVDLSD